mgnify:CR=1 FL=1
MIVFPDSDEVVGVDGKSLSNQEFGKGTFTRLGSTTDGNGEIIFTE